MSVLAAVGQLDVDSRKIYSWFSDSPRVEVEVSLWLCRLECSIVFR